jgi:hypothetical protein
VPKRKKSTPALYGLRKGTFPKNIRERVDYDYLSDLSPAEKEWLHKFNVAYYGADFRLDVDKEWDTTARRKSYTAKNVVNRDAYSIAPVYPLDRPEDIPAEADLSPTPAVLNSATYKAALSWWRQHVQNKTTNSPEGRAAKWRLEKVIRDEEDDEAADP